MKHKIVNNLDDLLLEQPNGEIMAALIKAQTESITKLVFGLADGVSDFLEPKQITSALVCSLMNVLLKPYTAIEEALTTQRCQCNDINCMAVEHAQIMLDEMLLNLAYFISTKADKMSPHRREFMMNLLEGDGKINVH